MDPLKKDYKNCSLDELIKADRSKGKTLGKKIGAGGVHKKQKVFKKAPNQQGPYKKPVQALKNKVIQKQRVHPQQGRGQPVQNPERRPFKKTQGYQPKPHYGHQAQQQRYPQKMLPQKMAPHPKKTLRVARQQQPVMPPRAQPQQAMPKERRPIQMPPTRPEKNALRFSNVRLKVRNIDNQKVTNDEIRKLFEGMGELVMCRFDFSDFGMFLGSATVQYKSPGDARKAIDEYHEGELDGKVITVEYDIEKGSAGVVAKGPEVSEQKVSAVIRTKQSIMNQSTVGPSAPKVHMGGAVGGAAVTKASLDEGLKVHQRRELSGVRK